MSKQHIEASLDKIRGIYQRAADKIESLKVGQKIPATVLAEEIAKDYGMTGPQLYPTLLFLIKGYPGVEIKRGAHGGIIKLPAGSAKSISVDSDRPIQVDVKDDIDDELPSEEDKTLPIINS